MAKTNIEWADKSLNFMKWYCQKVSPGCKHCYMMAMAKLYPHLASNRPQLREPDRIKAELRKLKPGDVVFVHSMSDSYLEAVPLEWIQYFHETAVSYPQVVFLMLTKRPQRALDLSADLDWPANLWIGTSVETKDFLFRLDTLFNIPAAGHFVSVEPLLAPLPELEPYLSRLGWVIVGGESGTRRRKFDKQWAIAIRDMCQQQDVPFLFKQGSADRSGQDRLLEGRAWNGQPQFLPPLPEQLELF